VSTTFLIYGVVFLVCVVIGSLLLSNPPAGYKPAGWSPPQPAAGAKKAGQELTQGETVKTPQFWMIWMAFVLGAGCGLMVIGSLKNFGEKEGGLSPAIAASALGLLALFNGLGRVVWGTLAQKLTARMALVIMAFLQAAMMCAMGLGMLGSSEITLAVAGCWVGFNFGGNFALFPLLTAEFFGTKNLGANYGAVFTSYGVGGILGPMLAGGVWDAMGTYKWAFLIAGAACVICGVIAISLRPPKAGALKSESA
jgi:OFA family oxalate/formate antiporter-like MFS transporter